MNIKRKSKRSHLSEDQVDDLVVSQAEDNSAWYPPIQVRRGRAGSFSIPADIAERAAFLARLHHASGIEEWLNRVIRERIEIEEVAYAAAKREIKSTEGSKRRPPVGSSLRPGR